MSILTQSMIRRRALISTGGNWWETDANLQGWWPFTADFTDSGPNGYDGTGFGDAAVSGSPAALQLDGTGDYVNVLGSDIIAGSTNRTVVIWVKTSTGGEQDAMSWGLTGVSGREWRCTVETNVIGIRVSGGNRTFTATNVNNGAWHCLSYVLNGTSTSDCAAYMDGVSLSVAGTGAQTINTASGETNIGRRNFTLASYFTGSIGRTFVFDRATDATENLQIYNGTKSYYGL